MFIVLPEDHSLAAREVVYWTELRNETIILSEYDPGREIEDLLVSKLMSPDDRPKIERHDMSPTISAGVAAMTPQAGLAPHDLIKSADLALYEAKHQGRDRSVAAPTIASLRNKLAA